jgi:cytosine/adenosine deaminase-related metal-dependent hydrolase
MNSALLRMKSQLPLLLLAAVHCLGAQQSAIIHVTVVDVLSGAELKDQSVVLKGHTIASITPFAAGTAFSGQVVDAHGGFLIPGLWDMHVHVHDSDELPLYVANGVTGVRIMSGARDERALRAELARQPISPQIYLASAIVDGPDPVWPGSIVIKKPEDARKEVDEIKASGADFIKVYDRIPRNAYFALADEARKQSIPFAGHVPEQVTAMEASAAGQRSMEHLQGIGIGCSSREQELMSEMSRIRFFRQKFVVEAEAFRSFDPAKCQALLNQFIQNATWQVPTLTVRRMWGRLDDSKMTRDPRLKYIGKASKERWTDRTAFQMERWGEPEFRVARAVFEADEKMVARIYKAGVPLMAGTDAMNPYCLPGFSLHDELALLVESGLPPLAALQTATVNPARFLGREASEGTVSEGKAANLVLLDADPLAGIHNTTRIQAVWLAGSYFDRQALDQVLETARQHAGR